MLLELSDPGQIPVFWARMHRGAPERASSTLSAHLLDWERPAGAAAAGGARLQEPGARAVEVGSACSGSGGIQRARQPGLARRQGGKHPHAVALMYVNSGLLSLDETTLQPACL
jgi:hypothetical protein